MRKLLNFGGKTLGGVGAVCALLAVNAQASSLPALDSDRLASPVDQVAILRQAVAEQLGNTEATPVHRPTRSPFLSALLLANHNGEDSHPLPMPTLEYHPYIPEPIVSTVLPPLEIHPATPSGSGDSVSVPDGGSTGAMLVLALGGLLLGQARLKQPRMVANQ